MFPASFLALKQKPTAGLQLAMGFSVPVLLNFQVSSSPAPVWAHIQQQQQHWQHTWRERLISSLHPRKVRLYCQCYLGRPLIETLDAAHQKSDSGLLGDEEARPELVDV
jgi:hypothetical protein